VIRSVVGIVLGFLGVALSIPWFIGSINGMTDPPAIGMMLSGLMFLICGVMAGSGIYQFATLKK